MSSWYSKNLGDAQWADESLDRVKSSFEVVCAKADDPSNVALFLRHESAGRLHCETVVYFSPAANKIAIQFGAAPCASPTQNDLSLLCGSEAAWKLLI